MSTYKKYLEKTNKVYGEGLVNMKTFQKSSSEKNKTNSGISEADKKTLSNIIQMLSKSNFETPALKENIDQFIDMLKNKLQ
jgi:hypothetical protein